MDKREAIYEFEWDKGNTNKNYQKHNITDKESEEVFINEPLMIKEDDKHSKKEKRLHALGKTSLNKKLFISFTLRDLKVEIISARMMSRKERRIYEKV